MFDSTKAVALVERIVNAHKAGIEHGRKAERERVFAEIDREIEGYEACLESAVFKDGYEEILGVLIDMRDGLGGGEKEKE